MREWSDCFLFVENNDNSPRRRVIYFFVFLIIHRYERISRDACGLDGQH
jgi:hypothetical protein